MSVIGRCIFLIRSQKVTQACRPNSFPIRAPLTATSDVPTLTRPCAALCGSTQSSHTVPAVCRVSCTCRLCSVKVTSTLGFSAKRGDSVKFARSYATPTKKLNLRFFGYFLLIMGFIGVWGERGRGEAIEDS